MDLEDRIRHALQDPTRGPSADFGARVLAALPARRRWLPWPPLRAAAALGAAVAAAVVLAVGVIGPAMGPGSTAAPVTGSPGASATVLAPSESYPDGIPRRIGGQPILRGTAILGHVAESEDDTTFLVGGYVNAFYADCYVEAGAPGSPLLAPCDDGFHLADAPPGANGGAGPRLVIGGTLQLLPGSGSGVVLRVHVHDPRATECAPEIRLRCEEAIVVEAVVWPAAEPAAWLPPWVGPATPAEVVNRPAFPFCGVEERGLAGLTDAEVRGCFSAALRGGSAAEFASIRSTIEGDPIATITRALPGGGLEILVDSTQDAFGARVWTRIICHGFVEDDEFGFAPEGCDEGVVIP
jgi:hypothetical protein